MSQSTPLQKNEEKNDRYVPYVSASGGGGGYTGVVPVNQTYVVANSVPDRSFDAATVLTPELAQVVAALIADLQAAKLIK